MDIQISSNFERLLFEAGGRDPQRIRELMAVFQDEGAFTLSPSELAAIGTLFSAYRADEAETAETMRRIYRATGYIADPHTSVGLAAAAKARQSTDAPMIVLATAHPAKFPDAVERAVGHAPAIPDSLRRVLSGREQFTPLDADAGAIRAFIKARARSAGKSVSP